MKKTKKNPSYLKKPRKNPRQSEKTQEPKIGSKNPRSWEKTQGVATLQPTSISRALKTSTNLCLIIAMVSTVLKVSKEITVTNCVTGGAPTTNNCISFT